MYLPKYYWFQNVRAESYCYHNSILGTLYFVLGTVNARNTGLKISNVECRMPNFDWRIKTSNYPNAILSTWYFVLCTTYLILATWYLCLNPTPSKNPKTSGRTNWTPCPTKSYAKKEQKDPSPVPTRSIRKQASTPARAVETLFFTRTSSTIAAAVGRVSPSPYDQKPSRCTWTTVTWWFEKRFSALPVEDT